MSSQIQRTLDIDSTYRNRNMFPYPSDFEIPMYFAQSSPNINDSVDPIAEAFPCVQNRPFGVYPGIFVTQVTLDSTALPYDSVYNNYYLENDCNQFGINHVYSRILSYNGVTKIATLETSILPTNNYNIRKEIPYLRSTLGAGNTMTTLNLGVTASSIDNFYINSYVRIFNGLAQYQYSQIVAYNGTTKIATILPMLSAVPNLGDGFEIMYFTKDNFSPLLYEGTTTFNMPVCYDVELLNLVLPNVFVKNGSAGTMDDYPYFYVKLYNINSRPVHSMMVTNNPNAKEALFRIPMHLYLKDESFFTLDKCKTVQTISMKLDDSLHFSVCLPNGEPLILRDEDYKSPCAPNPFLQISATFGLKRRGM